MNLYLVYVKSTIDILTGATSKSVVSIRVPTTKNPFNGLELSDIKRSLIGDQVAIWLMAEDPSDIELKLIECGFKSITDFIQNYSKAI
jgi:hypothetical protein